RVTITRSNHPFQGQSLELLRHACMRGSLQFVLILPDGSKSLIPADWTDFAGISPTSQTQANHLIGSLKDLLRIRSLTDALLNRPAQRAAQPVLEESHAATQSELHRDPHPGDVPVGTVRRRAKTDRHRDSGAPAGQSHQNQKPGAAQ
ncbi:MAG: hypothetical protein H0X25_16195, partial [Acidobacteriales bacterium]|nr:hypothetical protein [Terriglobales bacterium]